VRHDLHAVLRGLAHDVRELGVHILRHIILGERELVVPGVHRRVLSEEEHIILVELRERGLHGLVTAEEAVEVLADLLDAVTARRLRLVHGAEQPAHLRVVHPDSRFDVARLRVLGPRFHARLHLRQGDLPIPISLHHGTARRDARVVRHDLHAVLRGLAHDVRELGVHILRHIILGERELVVPGVHRRVLSEEEHIILVELRERGLHGLVTAEEAVEVLADLLDAVTARRLRLVHGAEQPAHLRVVHPDSRFDVARLRVLGPRFHAGLHVRQADRLLGAAAASEEPLHEAADAHPRVARPIAVGLRELPVGEVAVEQLRRLSDRGVPIQDRVGRGRRRPLARERTGREARRRRSLHPVREAHDRRHAEEGGHKALLARPAHADTTQHRALGHGKRCLEIHRNRAVVARILEP